MTTALVTGSARTYPVGDLNTEPINLQRIDWDRLDRDCQLWAAFTRGARSFSYAETFGILTNIIHLEGGVKRFIAALATRPDEYNQAKFASFDDHIARWKLHAEYLRARRYRPMWYENFYPDAATYTDCKTMVDVAVGLKRGEVRVRSSRPLIALPEAEARFDGLFRGAMSDMSDTLHVLIAPTGLGKTELYLNEHDVIIALPTHALVAQVAARMKTAGNAPYVLPKPPDGAHMRGYDQLLRIGAYEKAAGYLRSLAVGNPAVERYLAERTSIEQSSDSRPILMTHAALLFTNARRSRIIIDEDIHASLLQTDTVLLRDLQRVTPHLKQLASTADAAYIRTVLDAIMIADDDVIQAPPAYDLDDPRAVEQVVSGLLVRSNVIGCLSCSHWIKTGDGSTVHFIRRNALPMLPTVILSATASRTMYDALFGARLNWQDIGRVETMGTVVQYGERSFSKHAMEHQAWRVEAARLLTGAIPVITHQAHRDDFAAVEATFGALTGIDHLGGKDLSVVGNYHRPPATYRLYAAALGLPTTGNTTMAYIPVTFNGLEFRFETFTHDDVLQRLQLELIAAEQIQAVGRARLIRNVCTVALFSNMPYEGAERRAIPDDVIRKAKAAP